MLQRNRKAFTVLSYALLIDKRAACMWFNIDGTDSIKRYSGFQNVFDKLIPVFLRNVLSTRVHREQWVMYCCNKNIHFK